MSATSVMAADRVYATDAVRDILAHTRSVRIRGEDPDAVRSILGDLLARRPDGIPEWWEGSLLAPPPHRAYRDLDGRHVHIVWIEPVAKAIEAAIGLAYPEAEQEDVKLMELPEQATGLALQVVRPLWYQPKQRALYKKLHHSNPQLCEPLLELVLPFAHRKLALMQAVNFSTSREWVPFWRGSAFPCLASQGDIVTLQHRTHRMGQILTNTGFVGLGWYGARDRAILSYAYTVLQGAAVWGASSGSTWGWGTVWVQAV